MENIKISAREDTPEVYMDAEKALIELTGRSMPENAISFYGPILNWLKEYARHPHKKTVFVVKLTYFNTASSKMLLEMLMILEEIQKQGNEILVRWQYPEDDEDIQEAGEEYREIVEVPFEVKPY